MHKISTELIEIYRRKYRKNMLVSFQDTLSTRNLDKAAEESNINIYRVCFFSCATSNVLRKIAAILKYLTRYEPFGIVVVYLQKCDFEKNGFKDFRHFLTRNLTQTPKRLDVLYEVVKTWSSYLINVLAHLKKLYMIRKC